MEKANKTVWQVLRGPKPRALAALACAVSLNAGPARASDLKPQTVAAFQKYVSVTDARFDSELAGRGPFLWFEAQPEPRRAAIQADLRAGKVVSERLETRENGVKLEIPGGLVHHWIGTVFIPGATLAETLAFEQDYDHHQEYFWPDVSVRRFYGAMEMISPSSIASTRRK